MKVFLLHRDRDFAMKPALNDAIFDAMLSGNPFLLRNIRRNRAATQGSPPSAAPGLDGVLAQDLELDTVWEAMADGDEFLYETAKRVVLSSLQEPAAIIYRQRVLADCLDNPATVRELYDLAVEALHNERKSGGFWLRGQPETILRNATQILALHVDVLRRVRRLADEKAAPFRSEGFTRFFAMLREELCDDYLHEVEQHLGELAFRRGVLESAELGQGDKGKNYIVRRPREQRWTERLPFGSREPHYSFTIAPRDEAGFRAIETIRARGINHVADAVAQAADHIKSFFSMLRLELAFYLGCLNLHERLEQKGEPTCFPEPLPADDLGLTAQGIYDVCLTLHIDDRIVGNDLAADGKPLVMITGANQGGKSTLLRAVGVAHLMMHCGMFVGAEEFRAAVCAGVFTHFKRKEDAAMEGGKLDEELARMSRIADEIKPHSMLLCNESFAATNEREGAEIARQVVRAMLDKQIRVLFVTHMYELANGFYEQHLGIALFLRAERQPDGRRTFKVRPGEPLPTSYGVDSYRRIFGRAPAASAAGARTRP